MIALHSQHLVRHAFNAETRGMGSATALSGPFLLPCRSQLHLAEVQWAQPGADSNPALSFCMSVPCTVEPELSSAIWTIHCPRVFLFLHITEFTHLLKTVSKIQWKLYFPLIRFYGNWIIFFQNFSILFFSWEKISNTLCLFCWRGLPPKPYILGSPFGIFCTYHKQSDLWKSNFHFANWS